MAPLPPTIKGWCPGALRPMETGDGLLVRLRLAGGALSSERGAAIGSLAETYGNGLIDLTQRGNLQLRGVSTATLPALTAALGELGLLDRDAIRAVIVSPLGGLDRAAQFDGRALVRALEAGLSSAPDLLDLPEKFCFLIDDGGCLGLDGVPADVRLIGLRGSVVVAINGGEGASIPIALVDVAGAPNAAIAAARAFMQLCGTAPARRMDQLVHALGPAEVARAAGFATNVSLPSLPVRFAGACDVIGVHEGFIGVAAPFGRLDAKQMRLLASLAEDGLRLTPWRALLLPNAKAKVLEPVEHADLIVSPRDARLAIAACPGQPACSSAQIDTRHTAHVLTSMAEEWGADGVAIHLSGCSKGCAHAHAVPITLVGRDGAYDLIFDGRADALPHLCGLDLAQAMTAIRAAQAGKMAP
jgi:precorrin-3B synthase